MIVGKTSKEIERLRWTGFWVSLFYLPVLL